MITLEAARIFVKYGGDSDALDRMSSAYERTALSVRMLSEIEILVLHLALDRARVASKSSGRETAALSGPERIDPEALILIEGFVERELPARK